jgi:hypothetical protein
LNANKILHFTTTTTTASSSSSNRTPFKAFQLIINQPVRPSDVVELECNTFPVVVAKKRYSTVVVVDFL